MDLYHFPRLVDIKIGEVLKCLWSIFWTSNHSTVGYDKQLQKSTWPALLLEISEPLILYNFKLGLPILRLIIIFHLWENL